MMPTTGRLPVAERVAARMMKPDPATPALPFEVTRKTASSAICWPKERSMPKAWPMNSEAKPR